jgi:protein kinase X
VYMMLDFVPGGDLFSNLRAARRFSPATVKHYAGCIILALDYVHSRGVVYRDLKPENLLLDIKGRIKLTDFGLAKKVTDRYAPYPTRAMDGAPKKGRAH